MADSDESGSAARPFERSELHPSRGAPADADRALFRAGDLNRAYPVGAAAVRHQKPVERPSDLRVDRLDHRIAIERDGHLAGLVAFPLDHVRLAILQADAAVGAGQQLRALAGHARQDQATLRVRHVSDAIKIIAARTDIAATRARRYEGVLQET